MNTPQVIEVSPGHMAGSQHVRVKLAGKTYRLHFYESFMSVSVTCRTGDSNVELAEARFLRPLFHDDPTFGPPTLKNIGLLRSLGVQVLVDRGIIDFQAALA